MKELTKINNELKAYVNEANFISTKCRNKLIMMLGEEFGIKFQLENYANIDVKILEDGSIEMRGDKYETSHDIKKISDIEQRYANFKEKADKLLQQKEKGQSNKKEIGNILNIFIVIVLSIVYLIIGLLALSAIISLNLFIASILVAILSSYLHPNIKDRFEQAKNYLKRKLK